VIAVGYFNSLHTLLPLADSPIKPSYQPKCRLQRRHLCITT
jgi:hypothetical protein